MNNKILVIAGPTAVGKTSLSITLAKKLNGEIVSADSMQIYKGLDIGTAKPTFAERDGIPHHMIDICNPSERFSVAQYVKLAERCIEDIIARNMLPIVVGGTGLYIDNLIYSNNFGELDVDMSIREKLIKASENEGNSKLLTELKEIDPEYAEKLHLNDTKRIIHALEIYYSTGKTQSQIIKESRMSPPKYQALYAVLDCSTRDTLYNRINARVDIMMRDGLIDEARKVIASDWYLGSTASQAIGYKEFLPFFNSETSLEKCVDCLKQHSRNYAKRQLTWFRHKEEARFYNIDQEDNIVDRIISDFNNI